MIDVSASARRRLSARLDDALTQLCGALVAAIVLVMAADLFGRNLLGLVMPSTAELATLLMIYMVFIGSAVALKRGMHFLIFEPRDKYPAAWLPWLEAAARCVLIGFSLVLVLYGVRLAISQMGQTSAAMQIPYGFFYLGMPVGGVLTILVALLEPLDRSGDERHEVLM
jgi:TRAP-type transport system small permease protein